MTKNKIDLRVSVIAALILVVALSRLIPSMHNFSPLGALGLFGAAFFKRKSLAFIIPIVSIWISDVLVNNILYASYYPSFTWFYEGFYWQYGSYLLIVLMALFLFKKVNTSRVVVGALTATVIFFLISNFGAWVTSPLYPKTFSGLMTSYVAGIPFLNNGLVGDLLYSTVFFGGFYLVTKRYPSLVKA